MVENYGELRGVFPVLQTPFRGTGEVDFRALRAELDWLATQGIDGVVVGMVSEVLRLSESERHEVVDVTCSTAGKHGLPAIISVGAESTMLAVRFARAAEKAGAAALMAIPPITTVLPQSAVQKYYSTIIEATSVPLVIQDASGYVGKPLSIALQAELLERYDQRVMFKPEAVPIGPRLTELREATAGRARVFEGTGGIALIDSYRRGIVGTMPGADVCWAIVAMWEALERGDFAAAYEIAGPLASLVSMQPTLDAFVVVQKYLLLRQGVLDDSLARAPLALELDAETRDEIDRLFEQLRRKTDMARRRELGVGSTASDRRLGIAGT